MLLDGLEAALRRRANIAARLSSRIAYPKEPGNLAEREPEPLRIANEREAVDDGGGEVPVTCRRSRRPRQKTEPLVVSNRVPADTGEPGDFAYRQTISHAPMIRAS